MFGNKALKVTPDERLELSAIPNRIAEIRREMSLSSNPKRLQARINALLSRQGFPIETSGLSRSQKAAANVMQLPKKVFDGSMTLAGCIPSNVMAGMLASKSDCESGYSLR